MYENNKDAIFWFTFTPENEIIKELENNNWDFDNINILMFYRKIKSIIQDINYKNIDKNLTNLTGEKLDSQIRKNSKSKLDIICESIQFHPSDSVERTRQEIIDMVIEKMPSELIKKNICQIFSND